MADLDFAVADAWADRYAAAPTLVFRLGVTAPAAVHAIALRCQIRIEPQRRGYGAEERELLADLFGEPSRWGDTLKPLQFATVSTMVPGFSGTREVELAVPVTYDLEVATGKYFASLRDGEIPLLMLFSGTVFARTAAGFAVEQISWACEARYRLPVQVWRELMDHYFPGQGWIRLNRDTLDELQRFKVSRTLPTWDEVIHTLLKEVRG
ncbi:DUF6084 family protein [Nonomuraea sp. NPDC046570]|uniref:DUF6084 family protein n=1 Tax=Nonomuraea sp. NPDC046570 TaxID=3155255 RepID=UPI0033E2E60F